MCGPPTAVVKGTATDAALWVEFASNVNVTGFTVADSLQGIMVRGSTKVSITDLQVQDTGYEGIHLYRNTTDSQVMHNTITRTGVADVAFGEGIYIGTSQRRWAEVTGGQPDRSDRNVVAFNTDHLRGSGGDRGEGGDVVRHHRRQHRQRAPARLPRHRVGPRDRQLVVRGDEQRQRRRRARIRVDDLGRRWGVKNQFFGNAGAVDASGYGVWVHQNEQGRAGGVRQRAHRRRKWTDE